jgi:hypothetical protein
MASTISEELAVDPSVSTFLQRRGAQEELRKICELARGCFPGLIGLEVTLQEDPDEDGRSQAVVCTRLAESYPDMQLRLGLRRYHERLVTEIPLPLCPLFALIIQFVSE